MIGVALLALLLVAAPRAGATTATLDSLDIQRTGDELVAIRDSNAPATIRLKAREKVLWQQAKGIVGVVLTDSRFLAVSTPSSGWKEIRLRRDEMYGADLQVGANLAMLLTRYRVVTLHGLSGMLTEERLSPQERVLASGVNEYIGVIVTTRRAIGLASRFLEPLNILMNVGESYESLKTLGTVATVRTSNRILIFHHGSGAWTEEALPLH